MKDSQGTERGRCEEIGCTCLDYCKPESGHKCDFCGHFPTNHKASVATPR